MLCMSEGRLWHEHWFLNSFLKWERMITVSFRALHVNFKLWSFLRHRNAGVGVTCHVHQFFKNGILKREMELCPIYSLIKFQLGLYQGKTKLHIA